MVPQSYAELETAKKECISMINRRAFVSSVTSALPLFGVDAMTDASMIREFFPKITKRFGLTPEQLEMMDEETKTIIYAIISNLGVKLIGKVITKEIALQVVKKFSRRFILKQGSKYIPIMGPLIAGGIGFGSMKIVGHMHVNDCYKVVKAYLDSKKVLIEAE